MMNWSGSQILKFIFAVLTAILLVGCVSNSQSTGSKNAEVEYSNKRSHFSKYAVLGVFDKYAGLFQGFIRVGSKGAEGDVELWRSDGPMTCKGTTFTMGQARFNQTMKHGVASLTCSDGRNIEMKWKLDTHGQGTGSGEDDRGNTLSYRYSPFKRYSWLPDMTEKHRKEFIKENRTKPVFSGQNAEAKKELEPKSATAVPEEKRKPRSFSTGTGFFISKTGHFVTNFHVIRGTKGVVAFMEDDRDYDARIIATDPINDIAIGKIDAKTKPISIFEGHAKKGEEVLALGYPLISLQGQEQKATFGRINSRSGLRSDIRFYQIDVPIQPGNSGGPLINSKGEVIGIVSKTLNQSAAIRSSGSLAQNVNYAIKSTYLIALIKSSVTIPVIAPPGKKFTMVENIQEYENSVFLILAEKKTVHP